MGLLSLRRTAILLDNVHITVSSVSSCRLINAWFVMLATCCLMADATLAASQGTLKTSSVIVLSVILPASILIIFVYRI